MILAGLALALGGTLSARERTGDVLIVEHPERLVLFSKYQQRLTSDESRGLPANVPMVLVRERDILGDGFTPCAAVEIGGEIFYILRDDRGGLSARGEPGRTEIFRHVSLFGDTILLLRGKALRLRPAWEKGEIPLQAGTRVVRMFELESKTYVRIPSAGGRFGWLSLSPSARASEWRELDSASAGTISPADMMLRVRPVVEGANRSLRRIYAALSQETARVHTPPYFHLSPSPGEIRCSLVPAGLSGSFSGSMRAMLPELERVLGGTGLHAGLSDGSILIPLR